MSTLIVKKYTRTRRASKLYGGRGEGREEEGDVETGGRLDDTLNTVRGRERTSECKLSMAQLKGLAHTIKPQLGVGRSNGNYRAGLNKRVTAISNASFHQRTPPTPPRCKQRGFNSEIYTYLGSCHSKMLLALTVLRRIMFTATVQ
jgi:hypothetical protein